MVIIDGETLTFDKIKRILMDKEKVGLSKTALEKVIKSRQAVEKIVEEERVIYGITTGFGKLSDVFIPKEDVEELQLNLIRSHACGVGEPFSENVAKIMLLLRANALMKGFSGVRPVVIERLIDCVNHEIIPVIPQQGSLGASGDLAPLSHLALVIMGEGEVFYEGEKQSALTVFQKNGLFPVTLTAKEGLALINGTQAMTAQGIIAYLEAERLAEEADAIASLTIEALRGIITAYNEKIHLARGYQEQVDVAKRLRTYLKDSKLVTQQGELRVQDAYSLRCIPQVHGATWQTLAYVKEKLSIEMNAATDNPLIFDDGELVISGGNFHGQPIALAMDYLGIAMAEIANISERRIERLVNPQLNDLPAFLSQKSGLESGAMILQYTAASLVSENKTLAHPASVDSIPSSANQEDHVSMGTIGSRHAYQIIKNVSNVLSIELFCAMLALQFRDKRLMAPKTTAILASLHNQVQPVTGDRIFSKDIKIINEWLMTKDWDQLLIPLKEENVHEA